MLTLKDKILLSPIRILSLIPLRGLYVLSWITYILIYYVLGYRRKVVLDNLRNSFPEKQGNELEKISKGYYKHLSDSVFEVIRMLQMSKKEVQRRFRVKNPEELSKYVNSKTNIVALISHYANWEWEAYNEHFLQFKMLGVYKPLSNKLFDRFYLHLRSRMGGAPLPMKHTLRAVMNGVKEEEPFMLYLVGDQRPQWGDLKYWTTFMNQDAPFTNGPEKIARKFKLPVVFVDIMQVKRGHYEVVIETVTANPMELAEHEITERYIRLVERQILRQPELYFWSHKRWKYKKEEILDKKQNN